MDLRKNEKMNILMELLTIEESLILCKIPSLLYSEDVSVLYVDQERYLKMAMRLDSNDPNILLRKKKLIVCK